MIIPKATAQRDLVVSNSLTFSGYGAQFQVPLWQTASRPVQTYDGLLGYNLDTARVEVRSGTQWRSHVKLDGDTMTGTLTLAVDPSGPMDAATKQYVDTRMGGAAALPLSGGALSGDLNVGGALTVDSSAAFNGPITSAGALTVTGKLSAQVVTATNLSCNFGALDNTVLGGTVPAALSATTGNFSGGITVTGTSTFNNPVVVNAVITPGRYTVAGLPASPTAGQTAYASNGRNSGEAAGAGTGTLVYANSAGAWLAAWSGVAVTV